MSDLRGFYIIKKDIGEVRREVSRLMSSYRSGVSINEEKIENRRYCELTWRLLESSFEQGMCGVEKYYYNQKQYWGIEISVRKNG